MLKIRPCALHHAETWQKKPGQTFPDRQTGPTPPQLSSRETMVKKLVARDAPTWQFNLASGKGGLI